MLKHQQNKHHESYFIIPCCNIQKKAEQKTTCFEHSNFLKVKDEKCFDCNSVKNYHFPIWVNFTPNKKQKK